MSEKVSRKVILPYIVRMNEPIEQIKGIVAEMPDSTAKKSFGLTVAALDKKFSIYNSPVVIQQGENLTDEEKEVLEKFRAEKAAKETLEQGEENKVPTENESVGKKKKKHV